MSKEERIRDENDELLLLILVVSNQSVRQNK